MLKKMSPEEEVRKLLVDGRDSLNQSTTELFAVANSWKKDHSQKIGPVLAPPWDNVWLGYERRRNKYWLAMVGLIPIGCGAAAIGSQGTTAQKFSFAGFLAYYVWMVVQAWSVIRFSCPRCGHQFNRRSWLLHQRRCCQHCNLSQGQVQ